VVLFPRRPEFCTSVENHCSLKCNGVPEVFLTKREGFVRPKSTEIDKGISHRQHRFVQEKKSEESPARELEPAAAHRLGVL
jgi:hypothetical protein